MITTTKIFIVLATLGLLVTTTTSFAGIGNVFGQVTPPPLESTPGNGSDKDETISLGKATIPVSSGEQIIIDIPFKDGNTYKLVPIK